MTDAEIKALIVDILGSIAPEADAGALAGDHRASHAYASAAAGADELVGSQHAPQPQIGTPHRIQRGWRS